MLFLQNFGYGGFIHEICPIVDMLDELLAAPHTTTNFSAGVHMNIPISTRSSTALHLLVLEDGTGWVANEPLVHNLSLVSMIADPADFKHYFTSRGDVVSLDTQGAAMMIGEGSGRIQTFWAFIMYIPGLPPAVSQTV